MTSHPAGPDDHPDPTAAPRTSLGHGSAHALVVALDVSVDLGVLGCTLTLVPPTLVESQLRVDVLPDAAAGATTSLAHT